ncbi:poly(U)-specific endoribonuclease-B-like isoform X1 [Branchiostoma floridae]|uniref:Uridylate-specific endoribonuclease n=3 Tax=Branchiostoma floridae TaxID=7739 RepID=A0A9J7MS15_BRAFL|nr:poly(U)-specific endoribonuclease-B-like isoform X1 [Branchiostoma floridae]
MQCTMESVSDVCARLWDLDHNRLKKGKDYRIKLTGNRLFSFVNREKMENIPTYRAFLELLDFYEAETSEPKEETERQYDLSRAFLNRCLETDVMKEAHSFLLSRDLVRQSYKKDFKELLYELWFELQPRPSGDGTERSAFEHVFVGETRNGLVLGFHNWVQLYDEERLGNLNYKRHRPQACDNRIITIDFTWNNNNKTFGSFFLGTSPEFELAIYTVCFLAGDENETTVILGNKPATILTNAYRVNGQNQIGACYPKFEKPERKDVHVPIDHEELIIPIDVEDTDHPRQRQKRKCCNCTIL